MRGHGLALACALFALATLSFARTARSQPAAPPQVLALIVTNNHSAELGRPELQYADDDGAKYLALFRAVASDADVELLTDFDRDSAGLFPEAREAAHPPTRAAVHAAVARLSVRAREATASGKRVEFYFVFAGHGDVDRGRGFLELSDGRLTSDDIGAMLSAIPAARAHVILDSCNSFFVLNPRRPGGSRLVVTEEAARNLSDRLPNVGVLLSTSAEAEVFEWSELQSGIFSHAVRSGLLGGADADGDGRISYDEIRAFVDVSNMTIENPLYRPKVFARGPNGRDDEPIFDLRAARALRLELDGRVEQRVTVRDAHELPWIDVHAEAGARTTLRLPLGMATGASVDERDAHAIGAPVVSRRNVGPGDGSAVQLAALGPRPLEGRGPNELLGKLFATPFGPRAFAQWREQVSREAEPVYGISSEDAERMRLLLFETSDLLAQGRRAAGAVLIAAGAVCAAGGAWMILDHELPLASPKTLGYTLAGEGAAYALGGIVLLATPTEGERLYDDYVRALAAPSIDGARVVAVTERRFLDLADRARRFRRIARPFGWVLAGASVAVFAGEEALDGNPQRRLELGVTTGIVGLLGLATAIVAMVPTPVERLADVWVSDPAIQRLPRRYDAPRVAFVPLPGGGASIHLTGEF
jgi:hypothetical protein